MSWSKEGKGRIASSLVRTLVVVFFLRWRGDLTLVDSTMDGGVVGGLEEADHA